YAVGADHAVWRERRGLCAGLRWNAALVARKLHETAQHLNEAAGDRKVGPRSLRSDVEQDQRALPLPQASYQRRSVGKACPGAIDNVGRRLRQHLPRYGDFRRRREIGEGADGWKLRYRLRCRPGQGAAETAFAHAKAHGKKILVIAGRGEPGTGEANQHAAFLDPLDQPWPRLFGDGAYIRHDDHGRLAVENLRNGLSEVGTARFHEIGKGRKRPADVVKRRKKGLRLVGIQLRKKADPAAF